MIDTTLASDNPLQFRKNLLKRKQKLIVIIDDKIRDEELQCYFNREAAKKSVLSSCKIDKNEYLAGEEILSTNQCRIIERTKFTYSPLGKALVK